MSKRIAAPMLAVSLALCVMMLCAAPAFGSVLGTPHDQAIGDQGTCSSCHIPHKAIGSRMWPANMSGQVTDYGVVGSLCYYCHGPGSVIPNAIQEFIMSASASNLLSHGRDTNSAPPGGDIIDSSGLPYATNGVFECTTCHNVHDNASEPFLRADIDVLCSNCHDDRLFVGGATTQTEGAWGAFYGVLNPGSHPVGTDVDGDNSDAGNSPIDMVAATDLHLPYNDATTGEHNLGGHLINGTDAPGAGAGITCVTCHAVHGVQVDTNPPGGGTAPVENLLVIPQPGSVTVGTEVVYNGDDDPRNALCEACHTTGAATIDASTGLTYAAGGGTLEPNPGGTIGTHPVDDLGAAGSASVSAFPPNWPVGSAAGTNVSPAPICESCHTPHPNANVARATILVGANTHILRGSEDDTLGTYICIQCHDFTEGAGHHPSNVAMGRLSDSQIGDQDPTLTCGDCHESGSGAHNWAGAGVGLDPDWEPAGNGRGPEASERNFIATSKECEDCHFSEVDPVIPRSPTNNSANDGSAVTHAWRTDSPGYQDIGEATHYLGPTAMDYTDGTINALTGTWPDGGWSRFDGTGAETGSVTCESCHDIEADKNAAGTALLLAFYRDGEQTSVSGDADPSGLCEGCHGTSPGGTGTPHPMTGDTVTRTGALLSTTTAAGPDRYIRPLADIMTASGAASEGRTTFSGDDEMNCDSCHQPHDADTDGGTYIYDSGEGIVPISAAEHDVISATTPADSRTPYRNYRGEDVTGLEDAAFCDSCHFYTD